MRAVNDSLNDSLTSSWSEIQSRFESVEAERHAAVSAAASATSMLADLEQRERKRTILAEIFFLVATTFGLRF